MRGSGEELGCWAVPEMLLLMPQSHTGSSSHQEMYRLSVKEKKKALHEKKYMCVCH